MRTSKPILSLQGIYKQYGEKVACNNIYLDLHPCQVHGLIGENGSGKSTLVKVISGVIQKDSGYIEKEQRPVDISSPLQARDLGIGTIFQHFSLFDTLSVMENISLGLPATYRKSDIQEKVERIADTYGLHLDLKAYVDSLSVGERQRLEIIRCLIREPQILIMDEPTSVLTPQEADKLLELVLRLKEKGCAILYISHRLSEIRSICQQLTILRHGSVVDVCTTSAISNEDIAAKMMGEDFQKQQKITKKLTTFTESALQVTGLSLDLRPEHAVALHDINFEVKKGEIYGIAGCAGHGQDLLSATLSGEIICKGVKFFGMEVGDTSVTARKKHGFGYIPEDRNGHSALLNLNLIDNALLGTHMNKLWRNGWLSAGKAKKFAQEIVQDYQVVCSGVEKQAATLSGGNLQKFVLGRVLQQQPKILLAVQPTWGLSVGATRLIHELLLRMAEESCAIVLISQNLDELMKVCHRISVMCEGKLSESVLTHETSVSEIGLLMSGISLEKGSSQSKAVS